MSETLQSANVSSGNHTDIFAARLADKTVGQCLKEFCSIQHRLEMKFSHCSMHADMEAWRKTSNKRPSVPPYSTGRLISEINIL